MIHTTKHHYCSSTLQAISSCVENNYFIFTAITSTAQS